MPNGMRCENVPIFIPVARHGKRRRKPTWRAFACPRRTYAPATAGPAGSGCGQGNGQLPLLNTFHLSQMTDDTGMLQHAIYSIPYCSEGYTTDDNARALIVSTLLNSSPLSASDKYLSLSRRYLAFLWFAFHDKTGRFRNFMNYDRKWQEEVGSEDSHGRALWALGTVLGISEDAGLRGAAGRLFEAAVGNLRFTSPRAWAFSILGMQAYLDRFPGDRVIQGSRNALANRLLDIYEQTRSAKWHWFEKVFPTRMRDCHRRFSSQDGEVTTSG